MDAFFAAVEIREHPEYRGKPIIVGGSPKSRGVVSTCSYEARKYGIHSAMASSLAAKLCPKAIFVRPHFELYKQASEKIRKIFAEFTNIIEPVSIDEAYLDVTKNKKNMVSATNIAKLIKTKIYQKTKLTASAGVSYNKFLAKIASDLDKPDGLVVITPERALRVLKKLPIGQFYGIGKVTEKKMKNLGIYHGKDLLKWSKMELVKHFGKAGNYFYNVVRGKDERPVQTTYKRKSLGKERTFSHDIKDINLMKKFLEELSGQISEKLIEKNIKGKTITLKIKYSDFTLKTRSLTVNEYLQKQKDIYYFASNLLDKNLIPGKKIRLLGISISNLFQNQNTEDDQLVFPL